MKKVLKRIFIVILIILLIFVVWKVSLYIMAKNIDKKMIKAFEGKDYYAKIKYLENGNIMEVWHTKDLEKRKFSVKALDGHEFENISWTDLNTNTTYNIVNNASTNTKIASINEEYEGIAVCVPGTSKYGYITQNFSNFNNYKLLERVRDYIYEIGMVASSIKTENLGGRECYVIQNWNMSKFYVDKENYLPVKQTGYAEREFEISFDIAPEDVQLPNLEEYYVNIN